jgi:hypothetical protein
MILDSATYDISMCYFLYYFMTSDKITMRFWPNLLTAALKILFQEHICTLGRLEGFLWFFPGIYSLFVPYFDTNDFYFSGHLAMNATLLYEFTCAHYNNSNTWFGVLKRFFWFMVMTNP